MADPLREIRLRKLAKQQARLPTTRTCDGCDVCCRAVGVAVLDKPAGVACRHLCGSPGRSCGIYPNHPKDCAEFYCLWRATDDVLSAAEHPNRVGYVMSFNDVWIFPLVITVHPDPQRPVAWQAPEALERFAWLADQWNCAVAIGQGALCQLVFFPKRMCMEKAGNEQMFVNGGERIALPLELFYPDQRPPAEQIADWVQKRRAVQAIPRHERSPRR
jgi:hypothetical protein